MGIYTSYIRFLAIIAVILTLTTGCATAFRPEPEPVPLYSTGFDLDAHQHYTMGYDAGGNTQTWREAFFYGTLTGIVAPAITTSTTMYTNRITTGNRTIASIAGVSTFGLVVYGGGRLAKHFSIPDSSHYTEHFSPAQWLAFEDGYEKKIGSKRSTGYTCGVIFGIVLDIYALIFYIGNAVQGME